MQKMFLVFSMVFYQFSVAFVPIDTTFDPGKQKSMGNYHGQLGAIKMVLDKIANSVNVAEELTNMEDLKKTMDALAGECKLCTKNQVEQINDYIDSINKSLSEQFNLAYKNLTNVSAKVGNIADIISALTSGAMEPQVAALALQHAAIGVQQSTNAILGQIQVLQAQAIQRQMAEEKMRQETTKAVADGFKKTPGL